MFLTFFVFQLFQNLQTLRHPNRHPNLPGIYPVQGLNVQDKLVSKPRDLKLGKSVAKI